MGNYFRSVWGWVIVAAMGALAIIFAAGVWYMIAIGFLPALGFLGAYGLAWITAPIVALLSMGMFLYGEQLRRYILDWERQNGKDEKYDDDGKFLYYENRWSNTGWITAIKWFVLIMDSAGIIYRVSLEQIPWYGKILLIIVLELLAFLPWPIGRIMFMVANRPAQAVRRDVREVVQIEEANQELRAARQSFKKRAPLPADMRPQIEAPRQEDFTQVTEEAHQGHK